MSKKEIIQDAKLVDDSRAKNRPARVPLSKRRLLEAKPREGFTRRFVNEELGAIDAYLAAGWTPVSGDEDNSVERIQNGSQLASVVRRVVNRDANARTQTAVLMEIPTDLYEEDQAAKQADINKSELNLDPARVKQPGADYGSMTRN